MAGGKETPRQKMIGMMYLVLTALLALNISKEVLDAFIVVDKGLGKTNTILQGKSSAALNVLATSSNPDKAKPFLAAAKQVEKRANDMLKYIDEQKARTMDASSNGSKDGAGFADFQVDGQTVELDQTDENDKLYITKPDENQQNTTLLIGPNPQEPRQDPWSAYALRGELEKFRDYLKSVTVKEVTGKTWKVPNGMSQSFDNTFKYEKEMEGKEGDQKEVTWETKNFYHMPLAAIMPVLSKLELDVENAKADLITALSSGVEGSSYKFTTLKPMVIPKSNYILRGDSISAQILLAAYDETNAPDIYLDNNGWNGTDSTLMNTEGLETLPIDITGLGDLKISTGGMSLGEHQYKGVINYQGPDGKTESYPFYTPTFTVAEPALVVSPTKMNVFYRGLPNPVEISVPGVPQDKITANCPGHTMSKGAGGEWIVKPGKAKEAKISVSATIDGKNVNMGVKDFRVKPIPDPVPSFNGKRPSDSTIPLNDAKNASGLGAKMENFDFDVKVSVKEFTMVFTRDGQVIEKKSTSNRVTSEQQANMKKLRRGEKVYIKDIMVKLPDGSTRKVANLTLKAT